jgi:hypothetical protein
VAQFHARGYRTEWPLSSPRLTELHRTARKEIQAHHR